MTVQVKLNECMHVIGKYEVKKGKHLSVALSTHFWLWHVQGRCIAVGARCL